MRIHYFIAVVVLLCVPGMVYGAPPATAPASPIADVVNDRTAFVVRLNLAAVDSQAMLDWASATTQPSKSDLRNEGASMAPDVMGDFMQGANFITTQISAYVNPIAATGVQWAYEIESADDFIADKPGATFVFPLYPKVDKAALQTTLSKVFQSGGKDFFLTLGHDFLYSTDAGDSKTWSDFASSPRADVTAVLDSRAPILLAVFATPELVAHLKQGMGDAPDEIKKPLNTLLDLAQSVELESTVPPDWTMVLTVQCQTADAASKVADAITDLRKEMVDTTPEESRPMVASMVKDLVPTVAGTKVQIALSNDQIGALATAGMPSVELARRSAELAVTINEIHLAEVAIVEYEADNNGTVPKTLSQLVDANLLAADWQKTPPRRGTTGITYVAPTHAVKPDQLVIYESYDQWPPIGVNVGFGDGHVETIETEAAFKALLKAAQDLNQAP